MSDAVERAGVRALLHQGGLMRQPEGALEALQEACRKELIRRHNKDHQEWVRDVLGVDAAEMLDQHGRDSGWYLALRHNRGKWHRIVGVKPSGIEGEVFVQVQCQFMGISLPPRQAADRILNGVHRRQRSTNPRYIEHNGDPYVRSIPHTHCSRCGWVW